MANFHTSSIRPLRIANPLAPDDGEYQPLDEARRQELLGQIDQDNGGFLSDLFWGLDTTGAVARGTLAGAKEGDWTRGLREAFASDEDRTAGRELLREYGVAGDEDNWGNFFGGLVAEIVVDPLALLSGPAKALTRAGRAADAAGLLRRAPELLSRQFVQTGGRGMDPELASRAANYLSRLKRGAISETEVAGRPLIGKRAASQFGTLDDLIQYADNPDEARRSVLNALGNNENALESLRGQPLGKQFGLGLPLQNPSIAFNAPGGRLLSDLMDTTGQLYRWSPVGRAVARFTDNSVGGAADAATQSVFAGADSAKRAAEAEARRESTYHAAKLYQRSPDAFTEEGNRALGRLIEKPTHTYGVYDDLTQHSDHLWESNHPAVRQYLDWWDEKAAQLPEEFTEAGLRGAKFSDPNITGYLPRVTDGLLEQAAYDNPSLGRVLRTITSDQMKRSAEMMVPGGRDTIAFNLSRDPFIAGGKRGAKNDQEAAQHIAEKLFGKRFTSDDAGYDAFGREYAYGSPHWTTNADGTMTFRPSASDGQIHDMNAGTPAIDANGNEVAWADPSDFPDLFHAPGAPAYTPEQMKQAGELARIMNRLPENVIKDVPLFGQHPAVSISKYVQGRAAAKATANSLYDALASSVTEAPPQLAEGGRHITLSEALNRVGARTTQSDIGEVGARQQMRSRLAQRLGVNEDSLDLSTLSVPEDAVDRLLKVREAFSSPLEVQELSKGMLAYNRNWKAGQLAWPARIVRDLQSGMISNWLEGALDVRAIPVVRRLFDLGAVTPYATAYDLAQKSAFDPKVVEFLKTFPRYAGESTDEVAAKFYADLAASDLMGGTRAMDRNAVVSGGPLTDLMIGTTPQTFLFGKNSAIRELASTNYNPFSRQFWDTDKNPIARAGAKAGNLSDTINRLTGYLSLLRQGVDPMEAAARMKRAHVDYASLTPVERMIRDYFVPFYAYQSRIAKEVGRQLLERPGGRYGQMLRGYERAQESGDDEYIPEQLRSQFSVAIDPENPVFGWLADPSGNSNSYFTGLDYPGLRELNMIRPSVSGTMDNVMSSMNPLLRAGYELGTGHDLFTKSDIDAVSRGYGPASKLTRAITGDPDAGTGYASAGLDRLIDLAPYVSRPTRLVTQIADQDAGLSLPTRLTHTAISQSGFGKIRDLTPTQIRQDAIRKLQEYAAPYTKDYVVSSIPKGMEGKVPQDAQDAVRLRRDLMRESRESSRRKRAGAVYNPFL
jgi:hypothetical protein